MFPRYAEGAIREALADTRVVAISGPRQAGKTTLARKIAGRERTFLTLDDAAVLASARRDPNGLVRSLDTAVIDEIQRAPELLLAIKQSVDEDTRPGRFLITGSADLQAIPRTQDSLAGRIEVVPLFPLAQAEILGHPHPPRFIDAAFAGDVPRPPDATSFDPDDAVAAVLAGGYPDAVARRNERRRADWYRAYVSAILTRDLADLATLDKIARVPNLVEVLAHHAGDLVNWANLGGKLGLDAATVQRYVTLLEHLFLVRRVRAYSGNDLKRVVSTPKLHFLDSGLLAGLLGLEAGRLRLDRQPLGPVLEAFVFAELTKLAGWSDARPAIYHYRDKDQVEVDFVLEDAQRGVVGIEVKAAATVRDSDFKGLRRLQAHLGDRFRLGLVLYDGDRLLPFGERLVAAPLSTLWQ